MTRWRTRCIAAAAAALVAAVAAASPSGAEPRSACVPGLSTLELGGGGRALMRVVPGAPNERLGLLLVLHDAGVSERNGLAEFGGIRSTRGLVLVAPHSRGPAWSLERRSGDDLATIGQALTQAFSRCAIDPRRVGIGGFAAGATSALSLGLTNGRLFRAVIALSPGALAAQTRVGRPRVFVAHGTRDPRSAFETTKSVLVPTLRREGYAVTFDAFAGGHTVPSTVSRAALRWFLR